MSDVFKAGATVRDYRIERRLGGGGQAVTWLARDKLGAAVVLKQLVLRHAETWKEIELFEREAAVLEAIDHPAIPRGLEHFELTHEGGVDFVIVQPWVDAPSLANLLADRRHFDLDTVVHIARSMLEILDWLHRRLPPIIHRDLKPSNILMGADHKIHLIDFGAVKTHLAIPGQGESTIVGTHGYMPAEQLMGHAGPRSDLYALGATLLHLVTGRHPATLPLDGLRLDFKRFTSLPAPVTSWLSTLIEPDPNDRPASARDALAALERALAPTPARPIEQASEPAAQRRFRPWMIGLLAVVVLGWLTLSKGSAPVPPTQTTTSAKPLVTNTTSSPFVAVEFARADNELVSVEPRRAALRKAEMGFPMSSLELAAVLTSTADKPITKLSAQVFLEGFEQRTQLVWNLVSELRPPLEPGESRVVTISFSDVPRRFDRVRLKLNETIFGELSESAATKAFEPGFASGVDRDLARRSLSFRQRRSIQLQAGPDEGRLVSDIEVRVEDPGAIRYMQMKPWCIAADGSKKDHGIADYGMQIYIDERYPQEAPWSQKGDVRVYRALCYPETTRVDWTIVELAPAAHQ